MRVLHLQTYQAVKIGPNYLTTFGPEKFEIEFNEAIQCWRLEERATGETVMVSMYNVPWFKIEKETRDDPRGASQADAGNEGAGSRSVRGGKRKGALQGAVREPLSGSEPIDVGF